MEHILKMSVRLLLVGALFVVGGCGGPSVPGDPQVFDWVEKELREKSLPPVEIDIASSDAEIRTDESGKRPPRMKIEGIVRVSFAESVYPPGSQVGWERFFVGTSSEQLAKGPTEDQKTVAKEYVQALQDISVMYLDPPAINYLLDQIPDVIARNENYWPYGARSREPRFVVWPWRSRSLLFAEEIPAGESFDADFELFADWNEERGDWVLDSASVRVVKPPQGSALLGTEEGDIRIEDMIGRMQKVIDARNQWVNE